MCNNSFIVRLLLAPLLFFGAEVTTFSQNTRPAELIGLATSYHQGFASVPLLTGSVTCTNGDKTFSTNLDNKDVALFGGFWFPKLQAGMTTLTYYDRDNNAIMSVTFETHPGTNLIFLDVNLPVEGDYSEEIIESSSDPEAKEGFVIKKIKNSPGSPGWFLARTDGKYLLMETIWPFVQTGDNILKILKSFKGVKSELLQYGWGFRIDTTKLECQQQEWCLVISENK